VGIDALNANTSGAWNTANGNNALKNNTSGNNNIGIGKDVNFNNQEGSNNTIIGYEAGKGTSLHNKSGNVFLGYQAGYNETGDNKLYIENSNSTTPLIWGDFANDSIRITGDLLVTEDVYGDSAKFLHYGGHSNFTIGSNGETATFGQGLITPAFQLSSAPTNGYYLQCDGSGNASWANISLYQPSSGNADSLASKQESWYLDSTDLVWVRAGTNAYLYDNTYGDNYGNIGIGTWIDLWWK